MILSWPAQTTHNATFVMDDYVTNKTIHISLTPEYSSDWFTYFYLFSCPSILLYRLNVQLFVVFKGSMYSSDDVAVFPHIAQPQYKHTKHDQPRKLPTEVWFMFWSILTAMNKLTYTRCFGSGLVTFISLGQHQKQDLFHNLFFFVHLQVPIEWYFIMYLLK